MLSWLAHKLLSHNMERLNAGDPGPQLRLIDEDSRLTFPGRSSWSGEFVGKEAVTEWLERFASTGLQIFPDEVVVKGFPWRTTICVRGTDYLRSAEGEMVYENRYVIWGHARWGRMTRLRGLRGHREAARARRVAGGARRRAREAAGRRLSRGADRLRCAAWAAPDTSVDVEIRGLSIYTHHGVTDAEQEVGQRLLLDVTFDVPSCDAVAHRPARGHGRLRGGLRHHLAGGHRAQLPDARAPGPRHRRAPGGAVRLRGR